MFYVLIGVARGAARARTLRRRAPSPTWRRCSTWSRWARSPTSSGSITPTASSSSNGLRRIRAGPHAAGDPRAVRRRRPRPGARDDLRPGLRRRSPAQCRGTHGRHVGRHRLPACRRRRDRGPARRASSIGSTANGATVEATMQEQALAAIDSRSSPATPITLCLYRADWHQGVVGIVASRLKDRFHRPVIVFAPGADGELRGSGRTIAGFHLRDALDLVAKRAPGTDHAFRRACVRGGPDAAGKPHCLVLPRSSSASRANGCRRRRCSRTIETDGELTPDELTLGPRAELGAGVWGQGFPRRCSRASSRSPGNAWSATSTRALVLTPAEAASTASLSMNPAPSRSASAPLTGLKSITTRARTRCR